jgi:SAM-dependent methyltransferase
MIADLPGTEGYTEHAAELVGRWQQLSLEDRPKEVLQLFPERPSRIIDIGAGIGVDAAGLAALGHVVVAVEPVAALREPGRALHPSPNIEWVDDRLPDLETLSLRAGTFDLVLLSAVWMHLDEGERRRGMVKVYSLLRQGGRIIMSLRHGPIPQGRRMYLVTWTETIDLAAQVGLRCILRLEANSVQQLNKSNGVTWTRLAFEK